MFSRYTGLAYADIKKLKRSEIIIGVDGEQWLVSCRQKTDISALFPHTLFHLKILLFTLQIILIFLHQSIQDLLRPWTMAPAAHFFSGPRTAPAPYCGLAMGVTVNGVLVTHFFYCKFY
jgi:hypothetical protein